MKKVLCLIFVLLMLLCGCVNDRQSDKFHNESTSNDNVFTKAESGNLVNASGVEYAHLANEGILYYLGNLEFQGSIKGEEKTSQHLDYSYQTGLFALKNDETNNILIRHAPDNEWFSIYRNSSLPPFDFSVDNCIRLELVSGVGNTENDAIHTTCGDGVVDTLEIAEFLSDVRSQKDPREAGLYDLVKMLDGMSENCYIFAVIYGFFKDEPNIVIRMDITSYNDLAYSVSIEGKEYVLPNEWVQRLQNS